MPLETDDSGLMQPLSQPKNVRRREKGAQVLSACCANAGLRLPLHQADIGQGFPVLGGDCIVARGRAERA